MKKLIQLIPLLIISAGIGIAMDNPNAMKTSLARYNPFGKIATHLTSPLNDAELILMLKRGDYDLLQQELARGLNAEYVFDSGEFKGRSLIQVVFGNSISNRDQIASRLLKHGANPRDLDEYIKVAVKAFNAETVKWLLEHGAEDATAYEVVSVIEGSAKGLRKEQLIKIKEYLGPQKTVVVPAIIAKPKAPASKIELPIVVAPLIKAKQIKQDAFTVLAQADEQKLFNALLSGKEDKVAEYLEMGVSPNFVFWKGASGKSLLKVAVTETLNNQEKIADLLLSYGADAQPLQDGLILAVERFDKPKVEWLLAKGATVTAQLKEKIQDLEKNNTHPVKQKKLAEIKTLLDAKRTIVAPAVTQFNKPLPPVPVKKPSAEQVAIIKNTYGKEEKK